MRQSIHRSVVLATLGLASTLALLGCPSKTTATTDAAPAPAASSAPVTTDTAPAAPLAPAPSAAAPISPHTVQPVHVDAGLLALLDGSALILDAGPLLTTADAGAVVASDGGATGVPSECTQYAAKQALCIAKMPPALQPAARAALAAGQANWPMLAASPAGRTALSTQCRALLVSVLSCN